MCALLLAERIRSFELYQDQIFKGKRQDRKVSTDHGNVHNYGTLHASLSPDCNLMAWLHGTSGRNGRMHMSGLLYRGLPCLGQSRGHVLRLPRGALVICITNGTAQCGGPCVAKPDGRALQGAVLCAHQTDLNVDVGCGIACTTTAHHR